MKSKNHRFFKKQDKILQKLQQEKANRKTFLAATPTPEERLERIIQWNKAKLGGKRIKQKVYTKSGEAWKQEYKHKKWYIRRKQILIRDHYCCTRCGSKRKLQVHHTLYDQHLHVWEYKDQYLITLCEFCHKKEHELKPIITFYTKTPLEKYKNKELI